MFATIRRSFRHATGMAVLVTVLTVPGLTADAQAQNIGETTSLKFAPADAAFYGTMLRNREQFEAIANSKLVNHPLVQMGIAGLREEWNNSNDPELIAFREFLESPEFQPLLKLLGDAVSDEVFVYGDKSFTDLLVLWNDVNAVLVKLIVETVPNGPSPEQEEAVASAIVNAIEKARMPTLMMGFRLRDTESAKTHLDQLEDALTQLFKDTEELESLRDRLKRVSIGGGDYVTMKLDGSLIPWDQISEDVKENIEAWEQSVEAMKKKTATISIGLRGDYLLVSIAPSNDHLKTLGDGKLLIDRDELAALRKHADKRITGIGYADARFMQNISRPDQTIDQVVMYAKMGLQFLPLDDDLQEEIVTDVQGIADDAKKLVTKSGARFSLSWLTDNGQESLTYDWSENRTYDGSKPLDIVNHVGGNPLVMFAGRTKASTAGYDLFKKVCKRGLYYFDKLGVDALDPDQRQLYLGLRKDLDPLLKRLDSITLDMLGPAFADQQGALVLDAKTTSKQWHLMLPPSAKPLPMFELGLVYGVSDRDLTVKTATAYKETLEEIVAAIQQALPGQLPPVSIPSPQTRDIPGGTLYFYPLPPELGVDAERFAPNAGLSDKYLALSIMPESTQRWLKSTPLTVGGAPLADSSRPLATATHFDFAGLVDATTPWLDYGADVYSGLALGGDPDAEAELEEMKKYMQTAHGFLKCFQGFSSATRMEDGAMVTHSEWRFQDIE